MGYLPMNAIVMTRTVLVALLASTLSAHAATAGKRDRQQATQSAAVHKWRLNRFIANFLVNRLVD